MSTENEQISKLTKFRFDYVDPTGANRQYEQESKSDGLRCVKLPFNLNPIVADEVTVTLEKGQETPEEIQDFDYFKYLVDNELAKGDITQYEERRRQSMTLKDLPKEYFVQAKNDQQDFPQLTYFDVTERDMFGYPAMSATNLLDNDGKGGIWGMHGLRKMEFIVTGMDLPETADFTERASLYWYKRDSEEISKIYETDIRWRKDFPKEEGRKYIAYINTNVLGESAAESNSNAPTFIGRFELHHEYMDEVIKYAFPVEVCVHDTTIDDKGKNHLLDINTVSIDFGTSSTCAAIRGTGRPYLFTLSGIEKRQEAGDNAYENPTNLMIYNWDEVYKQWQPSNPNCPFVLAKNSQHDESEAGYDSGYTVEDEYKSVGDEKGRRKMNAILTELKLIPYLNSYGKEKKFTPYWGKTREYIQVTDSLDDAENTSQKFNPIAFYGYLLSRAINNPANNRFYRNYRITYPVKFDIDVRESIRASLERGIIRALPKPLQNAKNKKKDKPLVSVTMEYAEPVACVGAIVAKQLKISSEDPEAKLFAIYDLGGGTMDFAFGMFRPSLTEQEKMRSKYAIEILGIGGDDKVGGEKLIHKLAYKIYKDNREVVNEKGIKFVLPRGELMPKGFEGLLSEDGDEIANTNVNLLKEKLTRPLFKYQGTIDNNLTAIGLEDTADGRAEDNESFILRLRDKFGKNVEVTLNVSGVDEFLKKELQSTIESFKGEMSEAFSGNKERLQAADIKNFSIDKPDDVYIFLGGNASKQHYVREMMNEEFKANAEKGHIQRIGEGQNVEDLDDKYAVNEKTAVAFGQLNLGQYFVSQDAISKEADMPPFQFNVGYKDTGTDQYVPVIKKNDNTRTWHEANLVDWENLITNLLYTTNPQCNPDTMEPLNEDVSDAVDEDFEGRMLYIRIFEEDSIEYRVRMNGDAPNDDEPADESMVLKLTMVKK